VGSSGVPAKLKVQLLKTCLLALSEIGLSFALASASSFAGGSDLRSLSPAKIYPRIVLLPSISCECEDDCWALDDSSRAPTIFQPASDE
jgi:hypothetical protein